MQKKVSQYLLTPGPLTTSSLTKEAMQRDVGSWDDEFRKITKEIREKLVEILLETSAKTDTLEADPYIAVPMQGSGTFSVEAMLGSFVPKDGKALVLSNGAYGKRCFESLRYFDRPSEIIDMGDFLPPDPHLIEKTLQKDLSISHVVVIHCETSSGILNPIEKISQVVEKENRSLLIDSMSTFGAIPIDAGKIKFDAIVSSANKCIEGVPGFGFVLAKKSILESSKDQSHSLSLDLYSQWKYMESTGQWRFTPPTHSVLAFLSALNQHKLEGGVLGRLARYEKNKSVLISGMKNLGFETLLSRKWLSPIIVAFLCPADQNFIFDKFYNLMKDKGFIIYPGKLTIADTFRIGCIGQVEGKTMKEVVSAVERSLNEMNVSSAAPSQLIIEEKERLDKLIF